MEPTEKENFAEAQTTMLAQTLKQIQSQWKQQQTTSTVIKHVIFGYIDLVKMDEPVWTNSMCNKLGRLYQGCETYSGTDTIEFILHRDKPKYRRATYYIEVCDIIPQKIENHRTRITEGGNIIYYPGEVRTLTSYLTTMKQHINSVISDITSRYMCMEVKYFYLNNCMDRAE